MAYGYGNSYGITRYAYSGGNAIPGSYVGNSYGYGYGGAGYGYGGTGYGYGGAPSDYGGGSYAYSGGVFYGYSANSYGTTYVS